jgi:hypothetical protein
MQWPDHTSRTPPGPLWLIFVGRLARPLQPPQCSAPRTDRNAVAPPLLSCETLPEHRNPHRSARPQPAAMPGLTSKRIFCCCSVVSNSANLAPPRRTTLHCRDATRAPSRGREPPSNHFHNPKAFPSHHPARRCIRSVENQHCPTRSHAIGARVRPRGFKCILLEREAMGAH